MKYFPFYIDLKKKSVLLIGGGEVAERKLDLLIKAKANVTIISPKTTPYILDIAEKNNITSQHPDIVNMLQKEADNIRKELGEVGRQGTDQRPGWPVYTGDPNANAKRKKQKK